MGSLLSQNEDQQNQKTSTKNKHLEKTEVAIINGQSNRQGKQWRQGTERRQAKQKAE
jgi:hypothetical protein